MPLNCLIVDDEPLAVALIVRHLEQFPEFTVTGKCRNIIDAVKLLSEHPVDLIFLDVHMPEIDGITFLSEKKNLPAVILTTAHREHALTAFELGVVDYLLKPISFLRFTKAIERFRTFYAAAQMPAPETTLAPGHKLLLKTGTELQKIDSATILYLQSQKDYINIFTEHRKVMIRSSMSGILQQLPKGEFIQIHRSYSIPLRRITGISAHFVSLGNLRLPVGQSYRALLRTRYKS